MPTLIHLRTFALLLEPRNGEAVPSLRDGEYVPLSVVTRLAPSVNPRQSAKAAPQTITDSQILRATSYEPVELISLDRYIPSSHGPPSPGT